MCEPTVLAAASFVSEGGSALLSAGAKNAQAAAVAAGAVSNYRLQMKDIGARQQEERQAAAVQVNNAIQATAEGVGSVRAAASEGGVTGNSVTALMSQLQGDLGNTELGIYRNRDSAVAQLQRGKLAAQADAARTIASAPPANPDATRLSIGTAALGFANARYKITHPPV